MSFETFNYIEAGFWFVLALITFSASITKRAEPFKFVLLVASVGFVLFGISDIIEVSTGAWWRPWWLLALKASCVITFIWCFLRFKKISAGST